MSANGTPFDYSARYFSGLESSWNRISYPLIMPHIVQVLQANSPRRILDLGCGTGIYGPLLASQGATVSGTDLAPEAIRLCRQSQYDQVKQCAAENVDFPGDAFDMVFTSEVLEHVDDYRAMLREILRLLKPGGVVLLTTTLYGTSIYQMIYAYRGGFLGLCRNIGLYLLGFWNERAAREFVLRWCYEALGGHFHGFHRRQLASDFRNCGFVRVRTTKFYAINPFPLADGLTMQTIWQSERPLPQKAILIACLAVARPVNTGLRKLGLLANNVVIEACKPLDAMSPT